MNYSNKPFELPVRYHVAPETQPKPKTGAAQTPPANSAFMWDIITGKLLRSLDPFPDARDAYAETLRILREQYAGT